MRGYGQKGIVEAVRAAGGEIFGVTSEPQTLATQARESWQVDFELVGDPHHEISELCRERGWLSLFVNRDTGMHDAHVSGSSHPKGYFQPGVLALTCEGRVLYRWRSRPTRKNMGGATERPDEGHVWERVRRALEEPAGASDAAPDERPVLGGIRALPWPLFVSLLLANGNFLGPRPFDLGRDGVANLGPRSARAIAKLLAFVAAWGLALLLLPAAWVLAAIVAWAAFVTPRLVVMHRAFQNEPVGEPEPW